VRTRADRSKFPPSDSFRWLDEKYHRRANFRWIARAIRDGWLAGPTHAARRAALQRKLWRLFDELTDREFIAWMEIQLAMSGGDLGRSDRFP
jgi:hypothetical protein